MFNEMSFIWLIVIIVLSFLELITSQLVSIWFVLAAVVSLIVSLFCYSIPIQLTVFVASSVLFLVGTRPFVKKIMSFKKEDTNLGRIIGKKGIVVTDIDNKLGVGQVKVLGNVWSAKALDDEIIKKDSMVVIKKIDGVKLIVEKLNY